MEVPNSWLVTFFSKSSAQCRPKSVLEVQAAHAVHVTGRFSGYFAFAGTGGRFAPVLLFPGWWLKASSAVPICRLHYPENEPRLGGQFKIGRLMSRCSEQREDRDNVVRA
jgi:hypothetical protein